MKDFSEIKKAIEDLQRPAPEVKAIKGDKGDRGEPGRGFRWRGKAHKGMGFSTNDVVHHDGSAWICTMPTTDLPPSDSWSLMAKAVNGVNGLDGRVGPQGPAGPRGADGPKGEPGAAGLVWQGAYRTGQQYEIGDTVSYEGGSYVCVAQTTQPPVTGNGWQVLVRRGDTGTPGPRGPKGETGFDASAIITLTNTTESTSSTTGALITAGGIGAAKDSFINGVRVGRGAGGVSTNTAVGSGALDSATTASRSVAVGFQAGKDISTSNSNTFIGYRAGKATTTGIANTVVGHDAFFTNISGSSCTAVGSDALNASTGNFNTALGQSAGINHTTGTNNTFIGRGADGAAATDSNVITLGNASITTLRCQVGSITTFSDARDKTHIEPLAFGLDLINALNPVSFTWNMRQPEPKDGEPVEVFGKVGIPDIGFIAQELQAAQQSVGVTIPGLVSTSNPDRLEASPNSILPVLVKAVQQLSAQVTALQAQVAALEG